MSALSAIAYIAMIVQWLFYLLFLSHGESFFELVLLPESSSWLWSLQFHLIPNFQSTFRRFFEHLPSEILVSPHSALFSFTDFWVNWELAALARCGSTKSAVMWRKKDGGRMESVWQVACLTSTPLSSISVLSGCHFKGIGHSFVFHPELFSKSFVYLL